MNTTQPQHLYSSFFFFFFLPHYLIIRMTDKQCLISHSFHILHYTTLSSPNLTLIHLFTRHFWFFRKHVLYVCFVRLSVCWTQLTNFRRAGSSFFCFNERYYFLILYFLIFNFHVYVNNYISFWYFFFIFNFIFAAFLFIFFLFCLATILSNGGNWCGCRCENLIY